MSWPSGLPSDDKFVIGVEILLVDRFRDSFRREIDEQHVPRLAFLQKRENPYVIRLPLASQRFGFAMVYGHHQGTSIQRIEDLANARRGFELRDRFEKLESARESVLKAPFRPGREVPERWLEVFVVNHACQILGCVELVFDEGPVDDLLRLAIFQDRERRWPCAGEEL